MKARWCAAVYVFLWLGMGKANSQTAPPVPTNYSLVFSDNFSGAVLDQSKWNYRTDTKALSAQVAANVAVSSGYLDLNMAQQSIAGKSWTGSGIVSKDNFRYGYYQVQAKITSNPGWHVSFWLFAGDGTTTFTPTAKTEIDDFEIISDNPKSIAMGDYFWNNGQYVSGNLRCSNNSYSPGFSTAAAFHYYGFEWTESGITFYIDGSNVCYINYPPTENTHDLVNIWLTTLGTQSDISVADNPSPNLFTGVSYYVRDYYVNALEPGYTEFEGSTPAWTTSAIPGYSNLPTRYANGSGAIAQWVPTILSAGNYDVRIWKVQASSSDPAAPVTVNYSGGSQTSTIDYTAGTSGWVDLGTFSFAAGSGGNVTLGYSGTGYARTSMVKFVRQ